VLRAAAVPGRRQAHKGLALFFVLGLALAGCSRAAPECSVDPAGLESARVKAVLDGDTLRLAGGEKVRLIGINTPEKGGGEGPAEPLAQEATAVLASMLGPGERVLLQAGIDPRDRHDRRLAHVFDPSGRNMAVELLRRGLGFHVAVSPNFGWLDCLQAAEQEAASAERGVWSLAVYDASAVGQLAPAQRGFVRIRDRVTHVSFKDNGWWVQLGGKVGLRIRPADQHLFRRGALRALEGREVEARGWLVPMPGDWWMMNLGHPAMLATGR
jgi:endonuclease YncB( thermonuclease family)